MPPGKNSTAPSRPLGGGASTSQGHPRTVFRRTLEHENLLVAEATAKEIGHVSLVEALELTALIARKAPRRQPRVAARWLVRYLEEHEKATLDEVTLLGSSLRALVIPKQHASELAILRKAARRG
jgi:hypothetical protein